MTNVQWEDYEDPVDESVIQGVEEIFGYCFPLDYIQFVKKYHGGYPEPNRFEYGERYKASIDRLLTFDTDEYESVQRLGGDFVEQYFDGKVIPFAIDAAGNLICFDYHHDKKCPIVVFWYHEENQLSFVCNSFTEFLEKLY
ncbi:SMI1/KNR4 family protein [Paludifilum halophilum]|uniref:Knr4/Smi1-like domain-containing protein n=1 Tax=Paludifilum halophilum TaxID=1642702 RepID=A0A235B785_9BACL|nr:SMI1/KNR4 family protein [Paludifilum halophilum]OYD07737.1 hypothetical protein CHM34_09710 [Paludifilum halophilum]